ncbi:MAG: hypothetical protein K9J35_01190 [Rhodoferax sp.]|nr:hypothetical protein [Rhodoferax sp.]
MKINIAHLGTGEWFNYKSEVIYGLFHTFNLLGYETTVSHNQMDPKCLNILIGADWIAKPEHINFMKKNQINYFIYEIEAIYQNTINGRGDFDFVSYLELIDNAKQIVTPYQFCINSYREIGFGDKISYVRWGFYEELIDQNIKRNISRSYLGVFFGLLKGNRMDTMSKLKVKFPDKFISLGYESPHLCRAYYLSKTNYSLSLSYGDKEHFINPFRLQYLVANGVAVISDSKKDDDGYLQMTTNVNTDLIHLEIQKSPMPPKQLEEIARSRSLFSELKVIFSKQ